MKLFSRIAARFREVLDAATLPATPAGPADRSEPIWRYHDGKPVPPAPIDVRMLRAKAKLLTVSRGTLAVRSAIQVDRLRAIFAGREVGSQEELDAINSGLDRISAERKALFEAADRAGIRVGLIF